MMGLGEVVRSMLAKTKWNILFGFSLVGIFPTSLQSM